MSPFTDALPDELDFSLPSEPAELGRLSTFLVCVSLTTAGAYWLSLRLRGVPVFDLLSSPGIAGLALPTLVYARYADLDLPLRVDASLTRVRLETVGTALSPVFAPILALVAVTVATPLVFGTSFAALVGSTFHPKASVLATASWWVEPTFLAGAGYGVLTALVFEHLRTRMSLSSRGAVLSAAALGTYFHGGLRSAALTLVSFPKQWRLGLFAILLVATVAGGITVGFVYWSAVERSIRVVYRPVFVPVFALGVVSLVAFVTLFAEIPGGFEHALWGLAFGCAAHGYARTGSVWVPVVTMSLFGLAVRLVGFVELAVF
ncbi:hypothetical protein GJR96_05405 [Haloferax sp. MBLA0076]|uniref:Uncharacterized protein n=1 Tax=Haloferax litoreum TaxID=2666140 RepID=A0A6A8GGY2_9EURY|nr:MULTISPECIES: hypothetical protein [Haloferax]KAB1192912.1 hypothetical protein Hfx1148_05405 [Haloferax sp. CBA1148]MRX21397.1 hypothetical protein [Haloferax litoreum]